MGDYGCTLKISAKSETMRTQHPIKHVWCLQRIALLLQIFKDQIVIIFYTKIFLLSTFIFQLPFKICSPSIHVSQPDILCNILFAFVVGSGGVVGGGGCLEEGHKTGMCISSETRETLW